VHVRRFKDTGWLAIADVVYGAGDGSATFGLTLSAPDPSQAHLNPRVIPTDEQLLGPLEADAEPSARELGEVRATVA
jgi:hypothetical protein